MWVEKPSRALIELSDPAMPCQNRHQPSVTPSFRALCVTRMSISGAGTASGEGGSDEMQGNSMLITVTQLSEQWEELLNGNWGELAEISSRESIIG